MIASHSYLEVSFNT